MPTLELPESWALVDADGACLGLTKSMLFDGTPHCVTADAALASFYSRKRDRDAATKRGERIVGMTNLDGVAALRKSLAQSAANR